MIAFLSSARSALTSALRESMLTLMVFSNLDIAYITVTLKSISDILLISIYISSVAEVAVSEFFLCSRFLLLFILVRGG